MFGLWRILCRILDDSLFIPVKPTVVSYSQTIVQIYWQSNIHSPIGLCLFGIHIITIGNGNFWKAGDKPHLTVVCHTILFFHNVIFLYHFDFLKSKYHLETFDWIGISVSLYHTLFTIALDRKSHNPPNKQ